MAGAGAVAAGRIDFALRVHEAPDEISVLEIDLIHLVLAEVAELFLLCNFHASRNS